MGKKSTFSEMKQKQQVFSIRKFNVGVASVAIATFWLASGGSLAAAEEVVSLETTGDQVVAVEEASDDSVELPDLDTTSQEIAEQVVEEELSSSEIEQAIEEVADDDIQVESIVEEVQAPTDEKQEETTEPAQPLIEEDKSQPEVVADRQVASVLTQTATPASSAEVSISYQVVYTDVETGEVVHQVRKLATGVAEASANGQKSLTITVENEVDTLPNLANYELASGQQEAIAATFVAGTGRQRQSLEFKVIRRAEVTGSSGEDNHDQLRAYMEKPSISGGASIIEGNQIFYPVTDQADYLNNYYDGSSYNVFKDAQITAYSNGDGTANLVLGVTVQPVQTNYRLSNQTTFQTFTLAMGAENGHTISLHQAYAEVDGVPVTPEFVIDRQGAAVRYFTASSRENLTAYIFSVPKAPATFPVVSFVITMTVPENVEITWGALSSATRNKEVSGRAVNDNASTNLSKTSGGQMTYINRFIVRGDIANDYDPVGQEQTVHTDERPDAAAAIKELDSANKPLPEGTTFSWKEEVDTSTAGDKTATVLVTYPDYSVDEVPVVVHVIPRNTAPTISASDATGFLNVSMDLRKTVTVADAEDDASDTDDKEKTVIYSVTYPTGFVTNIHENAADTFLPTQVGEYKVRVTVVDSDGADAIAEFILKVTSQADHYEPIVQDNKVDENQVPQAENSIANKDELPEGTTIEWQEVPDTSTLGEVPATIIVTYPDGSKDEVLVVVTIEDQTAPTVTIETVRPNSKSVLGRTEPNATVVVTFPNGETVETTAGENGRYSAPIPVTVSLIVGDEVSSVAIDAAGNRSEPATTIVRPNGGVIIVEDIVRPKGQTQIVGLTETVDPEKSLANRDELPEGTVVSWKETPDTSRAGETTAVLVATYSNGNKIEETVTIIVTNEPPTLELYDDAKGWLGIPQDLSATVWVTDKEDDASDEDDLVKTFSYEVITPSNKVMYLTEEEGANFTPDETGEYIVFATVTDSQGESIEVIYVLDVTNQALENEPQAQPISVELNATPQVEDAISNLADLPEGTQIEWKAEPDTSKAGTVPATVVVNYPDGSSEEVLVTVTVVNELPTISATDQKGSLGVAHDLTDGVSANDKEDDASADDDLTKVVTYELTTPSNHRIRLTEETAKSFKPNETGLYRIVATVTDSQGATASADFTLTVTSQADENDPVGQSITVGLSETPQAEDGISNLPSLPEGTVLEWKDEPDTSKAGTVPATVVVNYPDGSSEEVSVNILVTNEAPTVSATDSKGSLSVPQDLTATVSANDKEDDVSPTDDYEKTVTYQVTTPNNETLILTESEAKSFTPTATGAHQVTVTVTDSQGATASADFTLTVTSQADENDPVGQFITVGLSETPQVADGIANVPSLPEGTVLEWKDEPDTSKAGTVPATVVVNYPDGSSEEVPVNILVTNEAPIVSATDTKGSLTVPQDLTATVSANDEEDDASPTDGYEKTVTYQVTTPNNEVLSLTESEAKSFTPTTTGAYQVTVTVTDSQGATASADFTLTVTSQADENDPVGQSITVGLSETPQVADGIANVPSLPEGTDLEWKDEPDTSKAGTVPATVVVNYPDGSSEEVPVNILVANEAPTVSATDSKGSLSVPQDLTATVSTSDKEDDAAPTDGYEKTVTYQVTTPNNEVLSLTESEAKSFAPTTTGAYQVTVTVTDSQGATASTDFTLTVTSQADENDPVGQLQETPLNTPVSAEDFISNLSDLPSGTIVEFVDDPNTAQVGVYPVEVVVTYPDGSTDTVSTELTVVDNRTDAEKYNPLGQSQTVRVNTQPEANQHITNLSDLPAGTTVSYKEAVDTSTVGGKSAIVIVTYPDSSQDEVPVVVNVRGSGIIIINPETDADQYTLEVTDQTVELGSPVSAEDSLTNLSDLPEGTSVEFTTPVDSSQVGDVVTTIVVTYPDDSREEIDVVVHIVDSRTDAERHTPVGQSQETTLNTPVSAEDFISNLSDLPSGTVVEFVDAPNTAQAGVYPVDVVVTYPDGSVDTISTELTVVDNRTDAEKYNPIGQSQTVRVNTQPEASQHITNLSDLPAGTTVSYKEAVDTSTVGGKPATVIVIYPDSSQDEVSVVVNVRGSGIIIINPETDADQYTPEVTDQTVDLGSPVSAEDSLTNLSDLPEGTSVEFTTPVDSSQVGDVVTTIVVTYPDDSREEIDVVVHIVDSRTDAERHTPVGQSQETTLNTPVSAEDFISNLSDLPSGTIVEFVDAPNTAQAGVYPVDVVVTYPDGTTDTVSTELTVVDNRTDAEKYNPTGQSQTVRVNTQPEANQHITDLSDLPAGTTVSYKDAVDTSTVGGKSAIVIVTYPDSSQDEVPVVVNVRGSGIIIINPETDADQYTPEVTDQTVDLGSPVSAEDSLTNLSDLPEGTSVEFTTPVDSSQVGDVVTTIVVTYPDDSKEEINVVVHIVDSSASEPEGDLPPATDDSDEGEDLPLFPTAPTSDSIPEVPVPSVTEGSDGSGETPTELPTSPTSEEVTPELPPVSTSDSDSEVLTPPVSDDSNEGEDFPSVPTAPTSDSVPELPVPSSTDSSEEPTSDEETSITPGTPISTPEVPVPSVTEGSDGSGETPTELPTSPTSEEVTPELPPVSTSDSDSEVLTPPVSDDSSGGEDFPTSPTAPTSESAPEVPVPSSTESSEDVPTLPTVSPEAPTSDEETSTTPGIPISTPEVVVPSVIEGSEGTGETPTELPTSPTSEEMTPELPPVSTSDSDSDVLTPPVTDDSNEGEDFPSVPTAPTSESTSEVPVPLPTDISEEVIVLPTVLPEDPTSDEEPSTTPGTPISVPEVVVPSVPEGSDDSGEIPTELPTRPTSEEVTPELPPVSTSGSEIEVVHPPVAGGSEEASGIPSPSPETPISDSDLSGGVIPAPQQPSSEGSPTENPNSGNVAAPDASSPVSHSDKELVNEMIKPSTGGAGAKNAASMIEDKVEMPTSETSTVVSSNHLATAAVSMGGKTHTDTLPATGDNQEAALSAIGLTTLLTAASVTRRRKRG